MSDNTSNDSAVGIPKELVGVLAFLVLAIAFPAWAVSDYAVYVSPPNGTDDTDVLQGALDECVQQQLDGCTVQLAAGTYLTKQLVAYDFQGTFKGMGRNLTTIEALPNLLVNAGDPFVQPCAPNLTTCLFPSLIVFVDGDIHVSDLSIKISAPPGTATAPWIMGGSTYTNLIDVLRFMGQRPTDVSIDRVAIEGLPDNSEYSPGFNVLNGVIYAGELARTTTPFDYYFMSGTLTVRNSSFKNMFDGVGQGGFIKSTQAIIGGSPSEGNVFEDVLVGIDMESSESSVFEISHNRSSGTYASMWVLPWLGVFVPSNPSQYFIHDNLFTSKGPYTDGILLLDDPENPWIHAMISNNEITVEPSENEPAYAGIEAVFTEGTIISNNHFVGSALLGIAVEAASQCMVKANNMEKITADWASIGLFTLNIGNEQEPILLPTSDSTVVGSGLKTDVYDEGDNNTLVGVNNMQGKPPGPAIRDAMKRKMEMIKSMRKY